MDNSTAKLSVYQLTTRIKSIRPYLLGVRESVCPFPVSRCLFHHVSLHSLTVDDTLRHESLPVLLPAKKSGRSAPIFLPTEQQFMHAG